MKIAKHVRALARTFAAMDLCPRSRTTASHRRPGAPAAHFLV